MLEFVLFPLNSFLSYFYSIFMSEFVFAPFTELIYMSEIIIVSQTGTFYLCEFVIFYYIENG